MNAPHPSAPRPGAVEQRVLAAVRPAVEATLDRAEAVAFLARLELLAQDVVEPLSVLYGDRHDVAALVEELVGVALAATAERPDDLRDLDRRREIDPAWFQRARMTGYVCYVDRFCGQLKDLPQRLDYLAELGVTYLHLMPLLQPRPGENDGGYAVMDYRAVDPRLGTMDDLREVAARLRERGIGLCIDLVLNHTAREHAWARGWLAGDPAYADFYRVFPDRTMPDAYEATIADVFPHQAPGSFTYVEEAGGWVWTTFFSYQWDLDYANPRVFGAMLSTLLWLANQGVDIFRMDAVPFMWKRLGTDCLNQPEVHAIIQAMHALVRVAAPGVIFKAEAIVAPEYLVPYLGGHDRYRPECELAYHNQLMVMLWSSLATKDARLAVQALRRLPAIPRLTSWVTYVRCHDDLGWAVSDADAAAVGWSGPAHRAFLCDFFAGDFPGSYARGARFGVNPLTGDARISGSAAALTGIDAARETGDPVELDLAIRRLLLLYSVAFSFGGIPLVYMGDEIALGNDAGYLADPVRAGDNRWMHRPPMDWAAAQRRHDPDSVAGRVFAGVARLARARRGLLALRTGAESAVLPVDDGRVLAYWRRHPRSGSFLGLANFSPEPASVPASLLPDAGVAAGETALSADGRPFTVSSGRVPLPGLGYAWIVER